MADNHPRFSDGNQRWHMEGVGSPVGNVVPEFHRQVYINTSNNQIWTSVGLTSADWELAND